MIKILKIILIGILTTAFRMVEQFLLPSGSSQNVLKPSIFVNNGTMPIAFTIYGIIAYSIIASIYLKIEKNISGKKLMKGLKYGIVCSLLWCIYLLEPLPHVGTNDILTYPIADSLALCFMGLLLGLLLSKKNLQTRKLPSIQTMYLESILIILCFFVGRIIQYVYVDIYSSYNTKPIHTIIWALFTGMIIAIVTLWFRSHYSNNDKSDYNDKSDDQWKNSLVVGVLFYGMNLLLFNFFMPIVFRTDVIDLFIRTIIDIITVTFGIYVSNVFIKSTNKASIKEVN
jgi:hypothetical protein